MALNTDFKVKNSLYVSNSACFVTQTDTLKILSAGTDLLDIFIQDEELAASCALTQGTGIGSFFFSTSADATVSIATLCNSNWNDAFTLATAALPKTGGNMSGAINMGACKITNLAEPTALQDAATKCYVDCSAAGTVCSVTAGNGTITIGGTATDPTVRIADACVTALSGAFCTATNDSNQGNIGLTRLNGTTSTLDIGLCIGDSPSFAGVTAGNVTVGLSDNNTITTTAGNLTIDPAGSLTIIKDNHLVTGDSTIYGNLSVTGDFTCIETTISTTSALSVTNTGTGPALFVCQTGVQPIAHFIDKEGCDIVFNNDGYVGIGTFSPACRLTVSGGISANGTLQIDGATTLNSTVTLGGVSAGAGNENTVVVKCGSGLLVTDVIDGKVWGTALVDGEGSDNSLPKYTNGTGTIGDSNITDDGTTITLNGNVTYGNGATVKQPSAGGTVSTEDKVFVGTVGTSATSVTTFTKSGLNSVKYEVTLQKGVNITTFEVHAAYNGTAPFGTVYAIVDAQAASQLVEVEITSTGSTIDLDITAAAVGTTATIYGKAKY